MKNKNTIFSDYPDVVTVEQLSTMLSISAKTAYKLVKSNPFPWDVPIRYLKFLSWIIWKYRINPFKPGRHMI